MFLKQTKCGTVEGDLQFHLLLFVCFVGSEVQLQKDLDRISPETERSGLTARRLHRKSSAVL